jgi:hypothetical protein
LLLGVSEPSTLKDGVPGVHAGDAPGSTLFALVRSGRIGSPGRLYRKTHARESAHQSTCLLHLFATTNRGSVPATAVSQNAISDDQHAVGDSDGSLLCSVSTSNAIEQIGQHILVFDMCHSPGILYERASKIAIAFPRAA